MYYIQDSEYEIAAQNGIPYSLVYNRVYSYGWTIKRAITQPVQKRSKERAMYAKIALKNGISRAVYYYRVKNGWDLKQAATEPKLSKEEVMQIRSEANRTRLSRSDAKTAKANNIPYGTVIARISVYGWSVKRAITEPVNTKYRSKKCN